MKRIILLLALLLLATPAHAQSTKAQLNTEVTTNYPDNTSGAITPTILRTTTNDMIASWQQAPRVNAQSGTTYTFTVGDYGYLVTFSNASPVAVTLPQGTGTFATWNAMACNKGAGSVTITPTTSTIGGAATLVLQQNQCATIVSDATNYQLSSVAFPGSQIAYSVLGNPTASSAAPSFTSSPTITGLGVIQNNAASFQIANAAAGSTLQLGSVTTSPGPGTGTQAVINHNPLAVGAGNRFDISGTNSRVDIASLGAVVNPRIIAADTNVFGVPVLIGGNQAGAGIVGTARAGPGLVGPFNINMVNLGTATSPVGANNSLSLNLWGTATLGDSQNIASFYNGCGTGIWTGTPGACPAGARLGEFGGWPSLPDGHFTQTETWSINGYLDAVATGTTSDGSYTALSNIVFAAATAPLTPEGVVGGFFVGAFAIGQYARAVNTFPCGVGCFIMHDQAAPPATGYAASTVFYSTAGVPHYVTSANQDNEIVGTARAQSLSSKTLVSPIITTTFTATGLVKNADLVNAATTVNGQTCTLGSTCTVTAAATSIAVGTTIVGAGTSTRVLFNNGALLGEYAVSGTGSVCMTAGCTLGTANIDRTNSIQQFANVFALQDPGDTSKILKFDASLISTATTRTLKGPNANGTLALIDLAQTFSAAQTFTSIAFSPTTGGIIGTTTNDNAGAGKVGQYVIASTAETQQSHNSATVTITIASPAVVTWGTTVPYVKDPNGVATCATINFTTSGALPTGLVAGTNYYVIGQSISGNTFQVATSCDNAIAGTAINTSGSQSGTQTGVPTFILTTANASVVAGMALPAGDWDLSADLTFLSAGTTSITQLITSSSTTTGTGNAPGQQTQLNTSAMVPGVANTATHAGPRRYSLSGTTTIYCVAYSTFSVSTLAAWGGCRARVMR